MSTMLLSFLCIFGLCSGHGQPPPAGDILGIATPQGAYISGPVESAAVTALGGALSGAVGAIWHATHTTRRMEVGGDNSIKSNGDQKATKPKTNKSGKLKWLVPWAPTKSIKYRQNGRDLTIIVGSELVFFPKSFEHSSQSEYGKFIKISKMKGKLKAKFQITHSSFKRYKEWIPKKLSKPKNKYFDKNQLTKMIQKYDMIGNPFPGLLKQMDTTLSKKTKSTPSGAYVLENDILKTFESLKNVRKGRLMDYYYNN
eukprot:148656_1